MSTGSRIKKLTVLRLPNTTESSKRVAIRKTDIIEKLQYLNATYLHGTCDVEKWSPKKRYTFTFCALVSRLVSV